jgi:peroxiredoxin
MLFGVLATLPARDYGPAIGSRMPDFELRDQNGKTRMLKNVLGPKGAVVLFFRSADW